MELSMSEAMIEIRFIESPLNKFLKVLRSNKQRAPCQRTLVDSKFLSTRSSGFFRDITTAQSGPFAEFSTRAGVVRIWKLAVSANDNNSARCVEGKRLQDLPEVNEATLRN